MDYSKKDLKNILENVTTIAMIGASSNPDRDSFKVMKYLIEKGYKVFPVNPNLIKNKITYILPINGITTIIPVRKFLLKKLFFFLAILFP